MALSKGQQTRQKMINLMYLVFIAMLALNISTEVLDGFVLINENTQEKIRITSERNDQLYSEINSSYERNSEKNGELYDLAQNVKQKTDSLFNYIEFLKFEIAKKSDGAEADANNIDYKDDLEASSEVMFSPINGQGNKLKTSLDTYRENVLLLISDDDKKKIVRSTLSTEPTKKARKDGKSWLQSSFENMPSIAAVTYLSELQQGVKQAEGEILNNLIQNVDVKDIRVNELNAFVVPESRMVMKGMPYKANIIVAAVDTTQLPRIVVQGKELAAEKKGLLELPTGTSGTFEFDGFIEIMDRNGFPMKRTFSEKYTVMEPMVTIAPLLMDVLYSGIDNKVSISVPGVATSDIVATSVDGGTLSLSGGGIWVAKPTAAKIGQKFIISVSAKVGGTTQFIGKKEFRIRALPQPLAFIEYKDQNGNPKVFRKGALSRAILLSTQGIKASIDDGILDIPFAVLGFKTFSMDAMGNVSPEVSNGGSFSSRQLDQMKRMNRGTRFFISDIKVKGPDGIEQELYPMQVIIN